MGRLDAFIPTPRLRELDTIDVGVPVDRAFETIRTLDLGELGIARGLFALRALPDHLAGRAPEPWDLRMTTLVASQHGFRLLAEEPGRGFVVGAIGKVWEPVIPFVDVPSDAYAAYAAPDEAKVAWELRADPLTTTTSRLSMEVRVTTTDDASWDRFRAYFALIGPFSRLIRKLMLRHVAHQLGTPEDAESTMALPGDELVPTAMAAHTDAITIEAPPERVWPWLVQMGAERGGWYSYDPLDNAGRPSATKLDPALAHLEVGQVLQALPGASGGFTVARIDPERALVLWGAFDSDTNQAVVLGDAMPAHHWRVSWAFVLEPQGSDATRLRVRVRGDWAPEHLVWRARASLFAHRFMEHEQLRNLKARAEGRV